MTDLASEGLNPDLYAMQLSIVVAIAEDGAIGRKGMLPWHLPADLQFFKKMTLGKPVIMGRRTWESLGKPLKDRMNIVLSKGFSHFPEGVVQARSLEEAIHLARNAGFTEASVIGGASLFEEAAPMADTLYITRVKTTVPDADTFFPEIDMSAWKLAWEESHEADEKNRIPYTFQRWEKKG